MHLVGYDLLSRPVMYSCLEMVTNRGIEDNRRHMISTFEQVQSLCHAATSSFDAVQHQQLLCASAEHLHDS